MPVGPYIYPFPFVLLKCKGDPRGGGWSLSGEKKWWGTWP